MTLGEVEATVTAGTEKKTFKIPCLTNTKAIKPGEELLCFKAAKREGPKWSVLPKAKPRFVPTNV